ncbi:uncharacterized protein LOC133887134 isoform X2 [Phragmites australis]|uniref:uncharacterized protein LOC133887134 isoform X2 n=1 Tax=Phragmites australis TaxID=29695 RepID=UPI002D77B428|nr:uncharacterized protein LOC133887134 isoform X2 [Phragmites australis]
MEEANIHVGDEASNSSDKIDKTSSARNILAPSENDLTTTLNLLASSENHLKKIVNILALSDNRLETIVSKLEWMDTKRDSTTAPAEVANSPINNADANKKKGLLSFVYALAGTLFLFHSSLVVFSVSYPGTQKALVSFDETKTKAICFVNFASWLGGGILMLPFASHFKDGESIDHAGFDIFICGLFLWLLLFIAEYCATLHVFLDIPIWAVCPFGIAFFLFAVLPSVGYIELQRPTLVSKWAKDMWEKIMGRGLRHEALPGPQV